MRKGQNSVKWKGNNEKKKHTQHKQRENERD